MSAKHGQLITEGRLRFWAASSTTVLLKTTHGAFKLFKIMFGPDGSLYVPFPYLETKRGILAEADPATEEDPKTLNLRRNGIVVDYDVKFSHHTSGIVHFSKAGQVELLPERRGFPLNGPIGRLFDLRFYWPEHFARLDRARKRDFYLEFNFGDPAPNALRVWAEWVRKKDIVDNIDPREPARIIGPAPSVTQRSTGLERKVLLLGQSKTSPLQDHVLMLSAEATEMATGADSATAIFLGGWDFHENQQPTTPRMLVFLYPILESAAATSAPSERNPPSSK